MVSRSLVTGSIAAHTQWGERDRRVMASASLISPVFTALSRAKSSSSCTWVTRTSYRKYWEKAWSCSAASTTHCSTGFGSTSNTGAAARGHDAGWRATGRLGDVLVGLLTGGTGGLAGEARKGCGLTVVLWPWAWGLRCRRTHGGGVAWPRPMEHDAQPHQGDQH